MDYARKGWKKVGHVDKPDGYLGFIAGNGDVYVKDAAKTKRSGHKKSKGRGSRKRGR